MRSNLDPFGEYDDYALWQVLQRVRLARPPSTTTLAAAAEQEGDCPMIASTIIQDLDKDLGKEGCRLPICERQLLCIARALLQDCTKLVIIEESHNLDPVAQNLIRSVIDQEFEESVRILVHDHAIPTLITPIPLDLNCDTPYAP